MVVEDDHQQRSTVVDRYPAAAEARPIGLDTRTGIRVRAFLTSRTLCSASGSLSIS